MKERSVVELHCGGVAGECDQPANLSCIKKHLL